MHDKIHIFHQFTTTTILLVIPVRISRKKVHRIFLLFQLLLLLFARRYKNTTYCDDRNWNENNIQNISYLWTCVVVTVWFRFQTDQYCTALVYEALNEIIIWTAVLFWLTSQDMAVICGEDRVNFLDFIRFKKKIFFLLFWSIFCLSN